MPPPPRRSQRPFPVGPEAIRVTYGPQDRPGSTISGLRGVRVGRKSVRGMERRRRQEVTGRPLRPPSVRPTTERPRSLPATAPATAVSGGSWERYCGRPPGWQSIGFVNHGRKSPNFNSDCTICVSCHWAVSDSITPTLRVSGQKMAGPIPRKKSRSSRPIHTPQAGHLTDRSRGRVLCAGDREDVSSPGSRRSRAYQPQR